MEEIKKSIKRYFQKVWDWSRKEANSLKILSLEESVDILWKNDTLSLPPILIVGKEPDFRLKESYDDAQEYLRKTTEWKFLYELFPERIGYVSAPFAPGSMWLPKREGNYELGLADVSKVWKNVCEIIKDSAKSDLLHNLGHSLDVPKEFIKIAGRYFSTEDPGEKGTIGHETDNQIRFIHQLANLLAGYVIEEKKKKEKGGKPKGVLLIDNNPKRKMVRIDTRFGGILKEEVSLQDVLNKLFSRFLDAFYYSKDFEILRSKLSGAEEEKHLTIEVEDRDNATIRKNIRDFDVILVDIFLGEDAPDGVELIELLTSKFPSIPSFALSVSDDFSIIRQAIKEGADYYILKNQIFSLLYIYYSYLDDLAEILDYLGEDCKKNLLGNIRYWTFKRNLLWFGDKCYHMIDHSFSHTLDDWSLLNQILIPLIKEGTKEGIFGEGDGLVYAFCMAVWLHDIGHKGSDVHGEPHLIRDNHGYISGELVLRYPGFFGVKDADEYYSHNSIDFSQVSALDMIYRREKVGLSLTEMIALFAMYHKSNAPLDWQEYQRLLGKKKAIPAEYYTGRDKKYENIITLQKILQKREARREEAKFLQLVALFRFVDSIDIRNIRVGDITERELKKAVIENDKEYQFKKLEREIRDLSMHFTQTPSESVLFVKSFYQDIRERIEAGKFTEIKLPKELLKDQQEELENYEALVDYASFIALQPTHFDLHSSVKEIRFEYKGNKRLLIILVTDKDEKELKENKVLERGKKEQSVYERLIGEECYVIKELEGAKNYLKDFFSQVNLRLMHESGRIYGERIWSEIQK